MTLRPEQIGDRGQPFEAVTKGYPQEGEKAVGWANSKDGAAQIVDALKLAPGFVAGHVVDRRTGEIVYETMKP